MVTGSGNRGKGIIEYFHFKNIAENRCHKSDETTLECDNNWSKGFCLGHGLEFYFSHIVELHSKCH